MRAPIAGCLRMIAHSYSSSLPGLSSTASGMPILPTSCSAAASPISSASAITQAGGACEPAAHAADALDVLAGLLVARLRGLREPAHDLELGLAQLGGALAHEPLEHGGLALQAAAVAPFGEVDGDQRARGGDEQRGQRRDDGDDVAGLERQLGADEPRGAERQRGQADRGGAEAQAQQRRGERERRDEEDVEPGGDVAQREAVQRGPDRVGLDLGAGHELRAAGRRRVHVLLGGRGGADDDHLAADGAEVELRVQDVHERQGRERFRPAAVVDQRVAGGERRLAHRVAGHPLGRRDGERRQPEETGGEARDQSRARRRRGWPRPPARGWP